MHDRSERADEGDSELISARVGGPTREGRHRGHEVRHPLVAAVESVLFDARTDSDDLCERHLGTPGVGAHRAHVGAHRSGCQDVRVTRSALRQRGCDGISGGTLDLVVERDEEFFAVGEQLVELSTRQTRFSADRRHRRLGVADGGEFAQCRVEKASTPLCQPVGDRTPGVRALARFGCHSSVVTVRMSRLSCHAQDCHIASMCLERNSCPFDVRQRPDGRSHCQPCRLHVSFSPSITPNLERSALRCGQRR